MAEEDQDQDHEVGYCKPPRDTRFQPGQSGNPKGRPKKTKDIEKLFDRELSRPLTVREHGELRRITKREALVKGIVNAALQGDPRARQMVVQYLKGFQDLEGFEIDTVAQETLEAYVKRQQQIGGAGEAPDAPDA